MKRAPLSIRVILLLAIGALTLTIVSLAALDIYTEWRKLERVHSLRQATMLSDRLFDSIEKLAIERDIVFSALHAADNGTMTDLDARLQKSRRDADQALAAANQDLQRYQFDDLAPDLQKIDAAYGELKKLRSEADAALALPLAQRDRQLSQHWFGGIASLITDMQDLWTDFSGHYTDIDPAVNLQMRFKYTLGIISEYAGRQRSLIGQLLAEDADPTPAEQADLLRWAGNVDTVWQISGALAKGGGLMPAIAPYIEDAKSHYYTVYDMMRDIFYIPGAHAPRPYPVSVEFWLDLATQENDSFYALKDAALAQSHRYVENLEIKAQQSIAWHAALMLFALGLCFYAFRVVAHRVIRPIRDMADALLDAVAGKPVTLVPTGARGDEIGKLAQALHISQQNTEEVRRYARALERSNSELDDFAYIASHDLKEPLRGLFNHACFLLEDNGEKLDKDSVSRLNRLMSLSQRMERLVNDLLYYSRIGRQELAIQPADMNAVIGDIRDTLDVFLNERGARITVPRPLPTVVCDKTRVVEVFRNLVTNAVKYNDAPEKTVEIGFLKECAATDGTLRHDVFFAKDNGRGIAPEFHKEIFRMFKRLQNATGEKEEGTGVGLTFVKKIIERHGGEIWLESEAGKGTTFYFTLKGKGLTKIAA